MGSKESTMNASKAPYYVKTDGGHYLYFDGYSGDYGWDLPGVSGAKMYLFNDLDFAKRGAGKAGALEDGTVSIRPNAIQPTHTYTWAIYSFDNHKKVG